MEGGSSSKTNEFAAGVFASAQDYLRRHRLDGWLVYDFRGSSLVLNLLYARRFLTRRVFLFVPANGDAELLVHSIDASQFAESPGLRKTVYLSWQEMNGWIEQHVAGRGTGRNIAMEYSPLAALPVASSTDGGTIDLVRSFGAEVLTSADLVQVCLARWSPAAQQKHAMASKKVGDIKDAAFDLIRSSIKAGREITELQVQRFITKSFDDAKLEYPDPPIVAVNAHSGDPHFELSETNSSKIQKGDWVLIDLWARELGEENIFSDITWVGCVGAPTSRQSQVFEAVKAGRDRCVQRAVDAWKRKEPIEGWQLDEATRQMIIAAGFGDFLRHRTGHSLSPGAKVHGLGVNIDNLETHDTRAIVPGIGYTVEPGVYLPEFGVRLEINVFVDPSRGPVVTSCIQDKIVELG